MSDDAGYAHYYVYDGTGRIIRMGTVSSDSVDLQARAPGESVITGDQDIGISLRLAAQAGKLPTHKIDLSNPQQPALVAVDVVADIKI